MRDPRSHSISELATDFDPGHHAPFSPAWDYQRLIISQIIFGTKSYLNCRMGSSRGTGGPVTAGKGKWGRGADQFEMLHARSPSAGLGAGSRPAGESAGLRDDVLERRPDSFLRSKGTGGPVTAGNKESGSAARISSKCSTRDPPRLGSGQALGPLVKARAFGMTSLSGGQICSSEAKEPAWPVTAVGNKEGAARISSKCSTRDPPRLGSGQAVGPLVKARAFGMTPWTRRLICSSEEGFGYCFQGLVRRAACTLRVRSATIPYSPAKVRTLGADEKLVRAIALP